MHMVSLTKMVMCFISKLSGLEWKMKAFPLNLLEMSVISNHEVLRCDNDQLALGFSCDRNCEFKTICVSSQNFLYIWLRFNAINNAITKNIDVHQAEMKNFQTPLETITNDWLKVIIKVRRQCKIYHNSSQRFNNSKLFRDVSGMNNLLIISLLLFHYYSKKIIMSFYWDNIGSCVNNINCCVCHFCNTSCTIHYTDYFQ